MNRNILLLTLCTVCSAAWAQEALFVPLGEASVKSTDEHILRARLVAIDDTVLAPWRDTAQPNAKSLLTLNLFEDTVLTFSPTRVAAGAGSFLLEGTAPGHDAAHVLLAQNGNVVAGIVHLGTRSFEIVPQSDGLHRIHEIDPKFAVSCGAADAHGVALPGEAASAKGIESFPVVDVLVLYTPVVRDAMGGTEGIEALIDLAIAQSNRAYFSSEIHVRARLVGSAEVDYEATGRLNRDLDHLSFIDDGVIDEVHVLRNEVAADCVLLLTETGDSAGLSWIMQENTTGFAQFAFGVVDYRYSLTRFVFTHELGHLMGAAHERSLATTPGIGPYAHALIREDWRTIMAAVSSSESILHFSNPFVAYEGLPTGRIGVGVNAADNARALSTTAPTVPRFRTRLFDVSPAMIDVPPNSGTVFLNVTNDGEASVMWEAVVDDGATWLGFGNGNTGTDDGVLSVGFEANPNSYRRDAIVRLLPNGASDSNVFAIIRQEAECPVEIFPDAPANVQASDSEFDTRIRVSWEPVEGAYQYRVFRGLEPDFEEAIDVSPWMTGTQFDDVSARGLYTPIPGCKALEEPPTLYYYWVKARNECGESEPSDYDEGMKALPPDSAAAAQWLAILLIAYGATRRRRTQQ